MSIIPTLYSARGDHKESFDNPPEHIDRCQVCEKMCKNPINSQDKLLRRTRAWMLSIKQKKVEQIARGGTNRGAL